MADYLERLIRRTSGQMPVIRPLVRSVYSALRPVNESVSEFEETVTFHEETGPSSGNSKASVLPTIEASDNSEAPPPTNNRGKIGHNETREKTIGSEISRQPFLRSTRVEHTPEPGKVTTRKLNAVQETTVEKVHGESHTVTGAAAGVSSGRETTVNSRTDTIDTLKTTRPGDETPVHTKLNSAELVIHEETVNRRTEHTVGPEFVGEQRFEIPETGENPRASTDDNTQRSEREEKVPAGEKNLVKKYIPETRPAGTYERPTPGSVSETVPARQELSRPNNIKVTIGRVEIKAIKQPERLRWQTPSLPKRPAVTLDAYLKERGEESR